MARFSDVQAGRSALYADVINGVYTDGNPNPGDEVLVDDDFFDSLSSHFDGVIVGAVNDDVLKKIEDKYGIK